MASGDTLFFSNTQAAEPGTQTANFAIPDTRNGHPVLNFASGTVVTTQFGGVIPSNYSAGGITVIPHFSAGTATGGTLVVGAAIERIGLVQDIDSDGYAATLFGTITMPGTAGNIGTVGISFSSGAAMDSLTNGEGYRVQIQRAGTFATDTMGGTAQLRFVEIKET